MSSEYKTLLEITVKASNNYPTTIESTPSDHLLLIQKNDPDGDSDDEDRVLLDKNAQHALYLILKNRFES